MFNVLRLREDLQGVQQTTFDMPQFFEGFRCAQLVTFELIYLGQTRASINE
jgi:hypothetical protein